MKIVKLLVISFLLSAGLFAQTYEESYIKSNPVVMSVVSPKVIGQYNDMKLTFDLIIDKEGVVQNIKFIHASTGSVSETLIEVLTESIGKWKFAPQERETKIILPILLKGNV